MHGETLHVTADNGGSEHSNPKSMDLIDEIEALLLSGSVQDNMGTINYNVENQTQSRSNFSGIFMC